MAKRALMLNDVMYLGRNYRASYKRSSLPEWSKFSRDETFADIDDC